MSILCLISHLLFLTLISINHEKSQDRRLVIKHEQAVIILQQELTVFRMKQRTEDIIW